MPSVSRAVAVLGAVVAVTLAPASGRAQLPLPLGSHLRVRGPTAHSSRFTGRLRALSNDSIAVALDDDPAATVPFAIADIGRVEVERDEKTREQAMTVMGTLGAAGGLTAAVFWCKHNPADCQEDIDNMVSSVGSDSSYAGPSLLMILGGAVLGSVIGYVLAPPPHWELFVFPAQTSNNTGSSRLLLNVGLRYSFGERRRR